MVTMIDTTDRIASPLFRALKDGGCVAAPEIDEARRGYCYEPNLGWMLMDERPYDF